MEEIWKDISGFEELYQVSNYGRVKSLPRKTGNQYCNGVIKKAYNEFGYNRIQLVRKDRKKWFFIHRLVAEAFIPNPNNLPQINHIDGNKTNNNVDNLEWCTQKQNTIHAYKNGLKKTRCIMQYDLSNNFIRNWDSIIDASRTLSIDRSSIQICCAGKYKTAGGYIWRYADK